jgi:hypothetical protein
MAKTKTKLYSEKEFKMHDVGFTLAPTGDIYFVSSCHIDIKESTPAKALLEIISVICITF